MTDFNPVKVAKAIDETYRHYLATTFTPRRAWFAEHYRQALDAAISNGELGGRLHLQPRRPYVTGCTLSALVDEGVLNPLMGGMLDHPLYQHQEQAVRAAVNNMDNLVIATGTGSGKTEAFLLPIVNSLLRESEAGPLTAGVRAVLLYPMNALASDQMKRFRELLKAFPDITYGRFVGPTPDKDATALREWHARPGAGPPPPGERLSRQAMRDSPPHILVTNYAMLERLLLLPENDVLFADTLRTIVMDEVHVYDGAKGTEIAMLLRRLRSRCVSSSLNIQCFAASATLGDGSATDNSKAASFASDLFGAPFTDTGVVTPTYAEAVPPGLSPDSVMLSLYEAVNRGEVVDASEPRWATAVDELARNPRDHAVRFHQVVRSPGGAFCCMHPAHPVGAARMRLQVGRDCRPCADSGTVSRLLELGSCRRCGWEYVVGRPAQGGKLLLVDEVGDDAKYFRIMRLNLPGVDDGELPEMEDNDESPAQGPTETAKWICLGCGALQGGTTCSDERCGSNVALEVWELAPRPGEESVRCGHCQNPGTGFGPVSRPAAGPDALSAVLATTLYQHLPPARPTGPDKDPILDKPGQGRKLLVFSDSRQDAAYFAPYLGDSYGRMLRRSLIVTALRVLASDATYTPPFEVNLIATQLTALIQDAGLAQGNNARSLALTWLRAEAVAMDQRQSLEGVGMVRWELPPHLGKYATSALTAAGLSEDSARSVLHLLLDTVRADAAVGCPAGVSPADALFLPRNTGHTLFEEGATSNGSAHRWLPASAQGNRRSKILRAALGAAPDDHARVKQVLQNVWSALIHDDHVLVMVRPGALAFSWASLHLALTEGEPLGWWCANCRRWSWWSAAGACATPSCSGTPGLQQRPRDHYAEQYGSLRPIPLSPQEHTAQWTAEQAENVQREFMAGDVTVLSCSTTFEMGVDLGDVSAVLCRNVPPTPANYVQRAGRAGRRSGDPSLVVTLARRRSHDAQYAETPDRLIAGTVPVPQLSLRNPDLLRRHLYAIALSSYLRANRGTSMHAGEFFTPDGAADELPLWLAQPGVVTKELVALDLSEESRRCLALPGDDWVWRLTQAGADGVGGWLVRAREAVREDQEVVEERRDDILQKINNREKTPSGKSYGQIYAHLDSVASELSNRDVVGLLANHGILPKYGFPVDVVSLRLKLNDSATTSGVERLDLSRDLRVALSEYFPGSEVVADGTFLRSIGLRKAPHGSFDALRWQFVTCDRCGWYKHARKVDSGHEVDLPSVCGRCEADLDGRPGSFVQPLYGFVAEVTDAHVGASRRPKRRGRTRTYLSSTELNDGEQWVRDESGIEVLQSANAHLLTLSTTAAALCFTCGYALPATPSKTSKRGRGTKISVEPPHPDARRPSQECSGTRFPSRLGHEYRSDVLQLKLKFGAQAECVCHEEGCRGPLESAAAALVAGAALVLGTSRDDLDAAVTGVVGDTATLMLFDTTPGGAGLARGAARQLSEVLRRSLLLADQCTCEEASSCYACLRNYHNQWRHDHLVRAAAAAILRPYVR